MTVKAQTETRRFQAEADRLLHLVTHALYSKKEIFLRELISNASDAADKLRFEALSNPDQALLKEDPDLKIWLDFDAEKRTLTIRDNGIGMTRDEMIENLGTIAKSGTLEFIKNLSDEQSKDASLIGQFGVGFYSSYVVADKVTVLSRRADASAEQGVRWESDGGGEFQIENIERPERGTEIILHLKKEEDEFLDAWRLKGIVTKYSDHILLPIMMKKQTTDSDENEEAEAEEEKDQAKAAPVEAQPEWEVVNQATALWTLPKNKIKEEEYNELYKHIAHDMEAPLAKTHNKVEGKLEYTNLLFIPAHAPFDMYDRQQRHGLKLYVQRVFIMDDAEQLLPLYLRFVRGIVDSNDLPLNVSREILQNNKVIESIRSGCIRRVLDLLEKLAEKEPDKYQKFWNEFGRVLKEGPVEDYANRDRIAKLLRFASTDQGTDEQVVSLDAYIKRMKPGQDKIYYITAESFNAAKNSPHLEIFRKKDIEVLVCYDRVDEWLFGHLTEHEGKMLQSVSKGEVNLDAVDKDEKAEEDKKSDEQVKETEKAFEEVTKRMKDALGERVSDVRTTNRLTDSPACLVSQAHGMSIHLQKMLQEAGQSVPMEKPILEINPEHPIITQLKTLNENEPFSKWADILFEQALLAEGGHLDDPASFVKRLNELLLKSV